MVLPLSTSFMEEYGLLHKYGNSRIHPSSILELY